MNNFDQITAYEVTTYEPGLKPSTRRFSGKFDAYAYAFEVINYKPLSLEREGAITTFKALKVEVEVEPVYQG